MESYDKLWQIQNLWTGVLHTLLNQGAELSDAIAAADTAAAAFKKVGIDA